MPRGKFSAQTRQKKQETLDAKAGRTKPPMDLIRDAVETAKAKHRKGVTGFDAYIFEVVGIVAPYYKEDLSKKDQASLKVLLENTPMKILEENFSSLLGTFPYTTTCHGGKRIRKQKLEKGLPAGHQVGQDARTRLEFEAYTVKQARAHGVKPGDFFLTKKSAETLARLIKNPPAKETAPVAAAPEAENPFGNSTEATGWDW